MFILEIFRIQGMFRHNETVTVFFAAPTCFFHVCRVASIKSNHQIKVSTVSMSTRRKRGDRHENEYIDPACMLLYSAGAISHSIHLRLRYVVKTNSKSIINSPIDNFSCQISQMPLRKLCKRDSRHLVGAVRFKSRI